MNTLTELPEGEILRSVSQYLLTRPVKDSYPEGENQPVVEQIEIRVHKYLNGERKGQFRAEPYLGFTYGAAAFIGEGATEEQALTETLRRMKSVPFNRIFPPAERQ